MCFKQHKNRYKQMGRAVALMQNPGTIATLDIDGSRFKQMVFIPKGQEEEYKQKYGDKLTIWFE